MRRSEVAHVLTVVPNYYDTFRCIGGACRHNCCIGWEIGIDDEALVRYRAMSGAFGERFVRAVSEEDGAHFVTDEAGRCPFLNRHGLCDIQATFGEPYLCDICREHPRFHNELPDRTESGLGLCCEAAARLMLSQSEPMTLVGDSEETTDEIVAWRDTVLSLLQERSRTIDERIEAVLAYCEATMPNAYLVEWAEALLSLERLDERWAEALLTLRDGNEAVSSAIPPSAYEQLLVYFVYRHAANAADRQGFATRVCFAVLGYRLIGALTAAVDGDFDTFCDLARAFSAEIEYSDENFDIVLELLGGVYHGSDIDG